jgi:Ca-activated chloride channel family protein
MNFDFANPHFTAPNWLWLALAGPLAVLALELYAARARRRELARLANPAALPLLLRTHSQARRWLKHGLNLLLVFLVGVALARPQWGEQTEKSESLGEDVMFVLDCSQSMTATDVHPTRLERAKVAIQEFVQGYGRGRVGLVAFAGQAFLQCPLTFDYDAFRDALTAVDERTIPVPGTDLGRGLNEGFAGVEKNSRRKILVLVSDGEDLEKSGIAAASRLARQGVIVFTLGVGTAAGSELYVTSPAGGRELLQTEQGQPVRSRLDASTLRAIAAATHGSYQALGPLGDGLDRVRVALAQPEGLARWVSQRRNGVDHFQVPVALGLGLLVVESLLGTRRSRRKVAATAPGLAPRLAVILLFGFAWTLHGAQFSAEPSGSARTLFNLGTSRLLAGQWREAENVLNAAVNANDPSIQPLALYNLGHVRFHAGQEMLKNVPHSDDLEAQGDQAIQAAGPVVKAADTALAGGDLRAAASAYRSVNSSLRSLKKLLDTIQGAVDSDGAALQRWQRAADDFRGAAELRAGYGRAETNAGFMDQHVADLTGERWRLQEIQTAVESQRAELQKRFDALKRMLPPEATRNEQGENSDAKSPDEKSPTQEQPNPGEQGKEMVLTPEEAMRLLSSLKLDASHQYSAQNLPDERNQHVGRSW